MLGGAVVFFAFVSFIAGSCAVANFIVKRRLPKVSEAITWIIWPIAITALCCCLPLSVPVLLNNYQLHKFGSNLYNYPLPPQTQITDRQAEVGLTGNGNHCDFVVEQSFVTSLSREEIAAYYADVVFPPARSEPQGWGDFWTTGIHQPIQPTLEFNETSSDGRLEFKLRLVDYGYPPGFDFRCH
jgi:hypothetical protein